MSVALDRKGDAKVLARNERTVQSKTMSGTFSVSFHEDAVVQKAKYQSIVATASVANGAKDESGRNDFVYYRKNIAWSKSPVLGITRKTRNVLNSMPPFINSSCKDVSSQQLCSVDPKTQP